MPIRFEEVYMYPAFDLDYGFSDFMSPSTSSDIQRGSRVYVDDSLSGLGSSSSASTNSQPFEKTIQRLYKQLEIAHSFYNKFAEDFKTETSGILGYHNDTITQQLWKLKIGKPKADRSPHSAVQDFEDMKRQTQQALKAAMHVNFNDISQHEGDDHRMARARMLRQKICNSNPMLCDLLEKAADDARYCILLVEELQLLKDAINPGRGGNPELFKDSVAPVEEKTSVEEGEDGVDENKSTDADQPTTW